LPNPKELGNAGSFFKNPIVSQDLYDAILKNYPEAPSFPAEEGMVKIPAGWLIENTGWKGKRKGNCGVHVNQALVLVNYGDASGQEILELSQNIMDDVFSKFKVILEREVNIV
jgi:UDP-N-acetylmuramate dehydrogenase